MRTRTSAVLVVMVSLLQNTVVSALLKNPWHATVKHHPLGRTTNLQNLPEQQNAATEQTLSPPQQQDYAAVASALFGNVRIPAALFAGAATASAFAMPLQDGLDGLRVGMAKRLYSIIMMGALSSQIVVVLVTTLAVSSLSTKDAAMSYSSPPTTTGSSLTDFLMDRYELEWLATRIHFFGGVLLFFLGIGLRGYITIECPIVAKAALGVILSSTVLCLAFWRHLDDGEVSSASSSTSSDARSFPTMGLPWRYCRALWKRSMTSAWFALSMILSMSTLAYIVFSIPHISQYLITITAATL
jgi:hypothetical protein